MIALERRTYIAIDRGDHTLRLIVVTIHAWHTWHSALRNLGTFATDFLLKPSEPLASAISFSFICTARKITSALGTLDHGSRRGSKRLASYLRLLRSVIHIFANESTVSHCFEVLSS